jgi:large subunit ribosomal protein L29
MANIVELRDLSEEKLRSKLEDAREEMFNLRFQNTAARLTNTARIHDVRREMAQIATILDQRQKAIDSAAQQTAVASVLKGQTWTASAKFNYEASAWIVKFSDESGGQLTSANVNLNRRQPKTRRERNKVN